MLFRTLLAAGLMSALPVSWADTPALPSAYLKSDLQVAQLTIPKSDVRRLVEEDSKAIGQPLRIGDVQRVDQALLNGGAARRGAWTEVDGRSVWALDIASEDAVSLDLHFSRFQLPEGAELYLSNADRSYVLGPIRGSDALADGQYYTALVPGERLRLEVVADSAQRDGINLHLAGVTYGYRGLFGLQDHPDTITSGACNIDVACPLGDTWGDQIDGVGQYIFTRPNGNYVCTGTLVANTAGTPVPYFLTANHCVSTEEVAQTMRVYWNYQSATCRTPGSGASGSSLPRPATFSNGATLRMTYSSNDTSLVELNAPVPPSEDPFFVGWDRRNLATPGNPQVTGAVTIHHPAGHEKRISKDDDSLSVTSYLSDAASASGSHYRIGNWEHGTTEGGSSGSALFAPSGHLIGTLHGGYASCSSNTQDWYGRIYQSWNGGGSNATRLSNWLDPAGTAPEVFDGYRGTPLDDADIAVTLSATPDPVDIGEQLSIVSNVSNSGPGAASNVSVSVSLPDGLAFASATGTGWSCSPSGDFVNCAYANPLNNGAASAVTVLANVVATETGPVTVSVEASAANPDPNGSNNSDSVEVEITGEPPRPDAIFCSGFEDGEDGSCGAAVDPDIVDSGVVNHTVTSAVGITGFSINWFTGATCNCDTETGYDINPYSQAGNLLSFWFYPNDDTLDRAGMVVGGKYAALPSGTVIGPAATFDAVDGNSMSVYMADWRAGTHGYLGFRFRNPVTNQINYGYAELDTTSGGGFPMTIVRYWYNSAGNPITIP
ncbi:DUF11 domain-containing protein [Pseudofulvimonas gallinarii]|uniref:Putative repeat protein (TIGR01451 family) n=1 Tax=Pseudofulvimonas gallinarii TaxID=634155 RepID=A0A4S3KTR1_9GAMM|nr:DUF11 domain-containing protein [Pseudofulvimonas gallinarii]TCS97161.1 putative repeat protein (TIGR01451 family) [Pseudofulvimonas gallinarii]THD12562.1 hypothetical protein B1808_12575 [Pseudofulvimonas gallinarii]